jgi:hypothetical protein
MRGVMKQVYNGSHQHVCRPSASPREARLEGCKRDVGETMECGDALREPSERREPLARVHEPIFYGERVTKTTWNLQV